MSARTRPGPVLAIVVSLVGHALALSGLLLVRTPPPPEPVAITVSMVEPTRPPPPPPPPEPKVAPAPDEPSPAQARPRSPVRPTPPAPDVQAIPAAKVQAPQIVAGLGEADLAGATTAGSGSGSGGGGCNMVRLLQTALRQNPRVQAAVAGAHADTIAAGKAILVWNGDWVRSSSQSGKGLAGIRQVIIMEIAFAPEACRADRMRGLVLISLDDAPGAARLALGDRDWRWSDLVFAR